MRRGAIGVCILSLGALFGSGCGKDYSAPELEATGRVPAGLGQVVDVSVRFPQLRPLNRMFAGVSIEIRLEIEGDGFGTHPARVFYSDDVEDLSDGRTSVYVTETAWSVAMLGPLRIDNTLFEVVLTGEPADGGWAASGRAFESLTATEGTFQSWRRHRFLVAGTDFFSEFGRLTQVELIRGEQIVVTGNLELVSSDAVLRATGGAVFAINRLTFDNLQRLDNEKQFRTAWQKEVGAGSNPHDVVLASEESGYVTRYEPPFDDLLEIDPRNGKKGRTLSLSGLAENPDGTPRADRMVRAEGAVFVGLQDIDRSFTLFGEGKLAVVDPERFEVVGTIPLGGKNPGAMELLRGEDGRTRIYVALAGIFTGLQDQELSGGVALVDAFDRVFERMALEDEEVGGNIGALAMASASLGYVVVSDEQFRNRVVAFDPERGTALRDLWESDFLIPEIEVDSGGVLALPNRDVFGPQLCLYRVPLSPDEEETPIGCAPLELPPFSVEALE